MRFPSRLLPVPVLVATALPPCGAVPFEPAKPVTAANGLELREFAKEPFLKNTVALGVDEEGRVYATSVVRRKAADLDIRQYREWIATDLSLTSVDEKRAFYHRELVDSNADKYRKRVKDQNKDGKVDWRDLTVLSDRIIRLEDTDRDGVADMATNFAEGFNTEVTGIAAGVTAWDGTVYATVEPDLWALRDTDGDGRADQRESLAHGFSVHVAYAGHNFSGPVIGPDGRIYSASTDKGMNVTSREGLNFAHPHSGVIARSELDGSGFEVFAYGLRNVQEPAFDQFGNLIGVDNDGDMKGEKERVVYITEGSDTGWRCNWQYRGGGYQPWLAEGLYIPHHEGQAAYITPCLTVYHDGPTGFAFNPGTALNAHYRDHFFMTGFPARKLYAFQLQPKGAAFEVIGDHVVANGVLMTGLHFGPDGALYVADWSAKGYELNDKGGVWKLDDPRETDGELRRTTWELLRADWSKPDRTKLTAHLAHPDQRVRMKAQFELVRRDEFAALDKVATDTKQTLLARLHAIWGLGQILRRPDARLDGPCALPTLLSDSEPEVRAQAAKVLGEAPLLREASSAGLMRLLAEDSARPAFFAAIALGRLAVPEALEPLVHYLADNGADPYPRHAAVMGLRGCATPTQLTALSTHQSTPVRLGAVLALRRHREAPLPFLLDKDSAVVAEAARAIHDDESIPAGLPALAALLESEPSDPIGEATVRRALSAALRLRQPEQAARVAAYAGKTTNPMPLRLLALELLAQWPEPEVLDSVEGRHRPLDPISPANIRPAVRGTLLALFAAEDKELSQQAQRAGAVYGLGIDPKKLLARVLKDGEDAADALRYLADADREVYGAAAEAGIRSRQPAVRAAALEAFFDTAPRRFLEMAGPALKSPDLVEPRTALALLGRATDPQAARLLGDVVQALSSGTLDAALALDVLEAAGTSKDAAVTKALAAYLAAKDSNDPLSPYLETLAGGDPTTGRALFNNHLAAQCVRCHAVDGDGSGIGPALAGIGEKDARYLLEALIVPGAAIAEGFGITTVTLSDGTSHTGRLLEEGPKQVVLQSATGEQDLRFPRGKVRTIDTQQVSSMPPMGALLTKRELRDVMAFLRSLK